LASDPAKCARLLPTLPLFPTPSFRQVRLCRVDLLGRGRRRGRLAGHPGRIHRQQSGPIRRPGCVWPPQKEYKHDPLCLIGRGETFNKRRRRVPQEINQQNSIPSPFTFELFSYFVLM
jgi:hypothetical protein